jgi:hypothetical protein
MWLSVLCGLVVVAAMFGFCVYLARLFAFRTQLRDGDSWGNRLAGHGPHDEVAYVSPRERLAALRARRRGRAADD